MNANIDSYLGWKSLLDLKLGIYWFLYFEYTKWMFWISTLVKPHVINQDVTIIQMKEYAISSLFSFLKLIIAALTLFWKSRKTNNIYQSTNRCKCSTSEVNFSQKN